MTLHSWFPTSIYVESCEPPLKNREKMIEYIDKFYEKNKYRFKEDSIFEAGNLTGDICDDYHLHHKSTFSWLNKEVFKNCKEYLESLGVDSDQLNIHATKAWPVVVTKGGYVPYHRHQNSVLSVVYYLQSNDESGKIEFRCSHTPIEHLPLRYKEGNGSNYTSGDYFPTPYKMIIFPSSLQHRVKPYTGDENRYSISYDIIVASKPKVPLEFTIPDPSEWRVLNSS